MVKVSQLKDRQGGPVRLSAFIDFQSSRWEQSALDPPLWYWPWGGRGLPVFHMDGNCNDEQQ